MVVAGALSLLLVSVGCDFYAIDVWEQVFVLLITKCLLVGSGRLISQEKTIAIGAHILGDILCFVRCYRRHLDLA